MTHDWMPSAAKLTPGQYRKRNSLSLDQHIREAAKRLGKGHKGMAEDWHWAQLLEEVGKEDLSSKQWIIARDAFSAGGQS